MPAGHLAAACPLIVELTKNADIFATKKLGSSPTVAHSMTHELAMQFTRPVVDAIVGLACAPVQGVQIDFTDATYAQASAVVKAAVYGHCSFAEASAVLAERLDAATGIEAIEKIRGAMDSLKSAGETAVHSATGTFLFVWAKVSNVISKRSEFTYKLEAAAKSKSAVHSVTLVRPETEAEFYEMTHLFIMTVIALGLASGRQSEWGMCRRSTRSSCSWAFDGDLRSGCIPTVPDRVHGHRFFKNYESSTCSTARARVTEATEARVAAGKTLHLGAVGPDTLSLMRQVFDAAYIFPMGATAKLLEPTKLRPTDDHTRTGLNAACDKCLEHREGPVYTVGQWSITRSTHMRRWGDAFCQVSRLMSQTSRRPSPCSPSLHGSGRSCSIASTRARATRVSCICTAISLVILARAVCQACSRSSSSTSS